MARSAPTPIDFSKIVPQQFCIPAVQSRQDLCQLSTFNLNRLIKYWNTQKAYLATLIITDQRVSEVFDELDKACAKKPRDDNAFSMHDFRNTQDEAALHHVNYNSVTFNYRNSASFRYCAWCEFCQRRYNEYPIPTPFCLILSQSFPSDTPFNQRCQVLSCDEAALKSYRAQHDARALEHETRRAEAIRILKILYAAARTRAAKNPS